MNIAVFLYLIIKRSVRYCPKMTFSRKWYRSRRFLMIIIMMMLTFTVYYLLKPPVAIPLDVIKRNMEKKLQAAIKLDKGTGCNIPHMDPFSKEVMQFDGPFTKVTCKGEDWVECYHSECRVKPSILATTSDVVCSYRDIVYEDDNRYHLSAAVTVRGAGAYRLETSDHVRVACTGQREFSILRSKWVGLAIGFRDSATPPPPPPGREHSLNVLVFGFDSASRNGFIRRMPKTYNFLLTQLNVTILNKYNILGDGTPATLFPILSGKTDLEFPDVRRRANSKLTLDPDMFIFSKLRKDGYRTAYFEDSPEVGSFQYRYTGFSRQPSDHYLRPFILEDRKTYRRGNYYCVGGRPTYALLMNLTQQFFSLDGKKYCFTLIGDISHDDFNLISTADEDTVEFLRFFIESGLTKDTLLFVMGDHGPRYASVRSTLQGRLEERLPLMAIRLPDSLASRRPETRSALEANADALSTPHDVHAAVLDALGLTRLGNPYRVQGADLPRGMSLLQPIPRNRSCSEAGIEPHWCACVSWRSVPANNPLHQRAADALVGYINWLTESVRTKCVLRTLRSVSWVMRQEHNEGVLSFKGTLEGAWYSGVFGPIIYAPVETYQAKITVGPGEGVFEASMTYSKETDKFEVDIRDISRTTRYNHEPDCIHRTHPHLNMFCYCKDQADDLGDNE